MIFFMNYVKYRFEKVFSTAIVRSEATKQSSDFNLLQAIRFLSYARNDISRDFTGSAIIQNKAKNRDLRPFRELQ